MLGTDTHKLPYFVHFSKQRLAKNLGISLGWWNQPSQHGDGGSLSRAVMPKKGEYLAIVHFQVYSVDCLEVTESFLQTSDLKNSVVCLLLLQLWVHNRLIVLLVHVVVFVCCGIPSAYFLINPGRYFASSLNLGSAPKPPAQAEVPWFCSAIGLLNSIVKVEA